MNLREPWAVLGNIREYCGLLGYLELIPLRTKGSPMSTRSRPGPPLKDYKWCNRLRKRIPNLGPKGFPG